MTGARDVPLSVAVRTDTGKVRPNNEDAWGTRWLANGRLLVVVADGMGGHAAGEVASRMAVEVLSDVVTSGDAAAEAGVEEATAAQLERGLSRANQAIIDEGRRVGRRGMGTTAIVAVVDGDQVNVAHVGDSRLFHVRGGAVIWRTTDHTRVQALVARGEIAEAEARFHADAGILTRALGHARMSNGEALKPEVRGEPLALLPGDALVMSSDGLHDLVDDEEIGDVVDGRTAESAADALVAEALERGGHDNVTVAVVVYGEVAGAAALAPASTSPSASAPMSPPPRVSQAVTVAEVPEGSELPPEPWWFWPAVVLGVGMMVLGMMMLGVALWLSR